MIPEKLFGLFGGAGVIIKDCTMIFVNIQPVFFVVLISVYYAVCIPKQSEELGILQEGALVGPKKAVPTSV
jgi:hypothetical protein